MIDADFIKEYMQDHPDKNILLDYEDQFGEELIEIIVPMVYDDISVLYPSIGKNKSIIPDNIVMYGVMHKLFESESFVQLRNQVQYTDSNSSVALSIKNNDYTQKSEMMRTQFLRLLEAFAATKFMSEGWGVTSSNASDTSYDVVNAGFYNSGMGLW